MFIATPTKNPAVVTGTFSVKSLLGNPLPARLMIDENTGVISGTLSATGTTATTIEFLGTGSYASKVEATVEIKVGEL